MPTDLIILTLLLGFISSVAATIFVSYVNFDGIKLLSIGNTNMKGSWSSQSTSNQVVIIDNARIEHQFFGIITGTMTTLIDGTPYEYHVRGRFVPKTPDRVVRYWFWPKNKGLIDHGTGIFKLVSDDIAEGTATIYGKSSQYRIASVQYTILKSK